MTAGPLRPVCFMVMPFGIKQVQPRPDGAPESIDFDALWHKALAPLLDELGYDAVRADQDTGSSIILEMLERLYFSDLVMADMTLPNGNVYYEVGIRHACQPRGCVLICADWARSLFDTAQMRRLRYPLAGGSISDADAEAIKAALRAAAPDLAAGMSPMYQTIPGFPDAAKIDPNRASAIRTQLRSLFEFQNRVRAIRLTRDPAERVRQAQAVRGQYPPDQAMPQSVAIEVAMLLRDCAGWQACIDYIDALPDEVSALPQLQEQRSLALSKTGNHLEAIAAIEGLIRSGGETAERRGLIGGRYKKLAYEARTSGDDAGFRDYLDQAIEQYEMGMRLDLNEYFSSCNLPRLYRLRGGPDDASRAVLAAQVALLACERAKARSVVEPWLNPTLLALAFDAGDVPAATRWVQVVQREGPAGWALDSLLADLEQSVGHAVDGTTREALSGLLARLKGLL